MGRWEPIKDWAEASTEPCVGLPCRCWAVCVSVCVFVCLCVGACVCENSLHVVHWVRAFIPGHLG